MAFHTVRLSCAIRSRGGSGRTRTAGSAIARASWPIVGRRLASGLLSGTCFCALYTGAAVASGVAAPGDALPCRSPPTPLNQSLNRDRSDYAGNRDRYVTRVDKSKGIRPRSSLEPVCVGGRRGAPGCRRRRSTCRKQSHSRSQEQRTFPHEVGIVMVSLSGHAHRVHHDPLQRIGVALLPSTPRLS